MNNQELEDMMEERGLTAPRITEGHIEEVIEDEQYGVIPGTTTTVCSLHLMNGATVVGTSACVSSTNFDEEIGRKLARKDAKRKIWELEGYLLLQRLKFGQIEWIADSMIAKLAHETNRAYCMFLGDMSQPTWEDAPEWQRDSAMNGVRFHRGNPDARPEDSHESWMAEKVADGWVYGEVKDPEAKTHPCIKPYDELPEAQRLKDHLFLAIVRTALSVQ